MRRELLVMEEPTVFGISFGEQYISQPSLLSSINITILISLLPLRMEGIVRNPNRMSEYP